MPLSWSSTSIASHQLPFTEHVPLDRGQHLLLGSACWQTGRSIQGIQLEEVAVRLAWRWSRATVAGLAEVVLALLRSARERGVALHAFVQRAGIGRQVVDYPVDPGPPRRVRIVTDESKSPGAGGRVRPAQGWRRVLAVTGMRLRYRRALLKALAGQFDRR